MSFTKPHIYRRQIIATGKYYIGKHNGNNKYYRGSGTEYLKDYNLYVKNREDDLIEEILEYVEDESILNEKEEYWLKHYDVVNNPLYYNLTYRSRGWSKVTPEQRLKISTSKTGKKMSEESSLKKSKKMRGKPKHTSDSKKEIGNKNRHPKPDGFKEKLQKPKTKEHCQNISKSKQRPVLQFDKQGNFIREWDSVVEAALTLEISRSGIYEALRGKIKTSGGFIWKLK